MHGVSRNGTPGVGVNVLLQDRVTKLIPAIESAIDAGALPNDTVHKLPPARRVTRIKSILRQYRVKQ